MSSRSTADLLTVVSDRNARAFNRSGTTRAVALDISKAFDRVDMLVFFSFFLSEFSSQTLSIYRTAGEGRGPSSTPLCHFHQLTNIETFICNFACEMTITYF